MQRRILSSLAVGLTAAGLALSTLVAPAGASTAARENPGRDSMVRDFTRVAVAPALYSKLQRLGVTPSSTKGADVVVYNGTPAFRFTITKVKNEGRKIYHVGGLKLSKGHHFITIKAPTIKVRQGYVSGKVVVDGTTLGRGNVFRLAKSNRPQYGDIRLVLTQIGATAIDDTFGINRFSRGDNVGFATVVMH